MQKATLEAMLVQIWFPKPPYFLPWVLVHLAAWANSTPMTIVHANPNRVGLIFANSWYLGFLSHAWTINGAMSMKISSLHDYEAGFSFPQHPYVIAYP
jgi:hypothetical protein